MRTKRELDAEDEVRAKALSLDDSTARRIANALGEYERLPTDSAAFEVVHSLWKADAITRADVLSELIFSPKLSPHDIAEAVHNAVLKRRTP